MARPAKGSGRRIGEFELIARYFAPLAKGFKGAGGLKSDNAFLTTDSRVLPAVGYVPFQNIIGRAQVIFFSIGENEPIWAIWRWPYAVRWNRLFKLVR